MNLVTAVVAMRPGPVHRVVMKSWDDVPVTMKNGLTSDSTIIDYHIEPIGTSGTNNSFCEYRLNLGHLRSNLRGELCDVFVMMTRNNQNVTVIDRVDVKKGCAEIIRINTLAGDTSIRDFTEQTRWIGLWRVTHDAMIP